jgi:hypothetical protein
VTAGFLGVPWLVWGSLALVVSALFAVVNPGVKAVGVRGWRFVVLRWFHALVWLLLALSFVMRGFLPSSGASNLIALSALLVYVTFLLTLIGRIS